METLFHPEQLLHVPQSYFSRGRMREPQEVPERARRLVQAVAELGFPIHTPEDAGLAPIAAVHDAGYLAFLQQAHAEWKRMPADWGEEVMSNVFVREPNPLKGVLAQAARYLADGSCPVGASTWRSAYWSAQSAVAGADLLLGGTRHAYALCRPPGHHARTDAAGGFCYLNASAIAAQRLRQRFEKVLVLDTDMHHGQGVQEIFYRRDDVVYVSVHADPTNFYPVVAGHADETGDGAGLGANHNFPVPHGASEQVFFEHVDRALEAAVRHRPDAVVFSLGFDIYQADPQSMVAVSTEGFAQLGRTVAGLGLPTLIVQEGGYHMETLGLNAKAFFSGFPERS